jgi:hypothetical protein
MGRGGKDQGEQADTTNNKSVTGKTAECSNNYRRQTHMKIIASNIPKKHWCSYLMP